MRSNVELNTIAFRRLRCQTKHPILHLLRHKSVKQTAEPFDTVYISFYKGLANGIGGAMLLGDADFCTEARVWLRRFGGNLYSVLPYAVASWSGFRRNCLVGSSCHDNLHEFGRFSFDHRQKKLARVLKLLQSNSAISSIVTFDPAIPDTNMVHGYLNRPYDECIEALKMVEQSTGIRVLTRLRRCEFGSRFEWVMGESNFMIADDAFLTGWDSFAQVLLED